MLARQEGLTKTYNRFHSPEETDADIKRLRELHVEMDYAVARAYGWNDLELGHGFHETKQGTRFTISEPARREVLDRLLELNHERYAEEVRLGLHDKKGKAKKSAKARSRRSSKSTSTPKLFGDDDDEAEPAPKAKPRSKGQSAKAKPAKKAPKRPTPRAPRLAELDTTDIMAAFRQAMRGRGWVERDELIKEVSLVLGYRRLTAQVAEVLRNHMRAAIRRRIIEIAALPEYVRHGALTLADYDKDELRRTLISVTRKGKVYEREEIIRAVALHLGFSRLTETIRGLIKWAINSAIRQGILDYDGSAIWREG